ncbi:MAG: hypothetical protein RMK29_12155 [Myxococcales bacterium]|nr:hypothetical protein [Myxococcota bacterium]MDW8282457.1 hypothetical protein [Myxococcales bacterium]
MEAAIAPMLQAIVRAGLPELTEAQRRLMAGQLTPEQRELLLCAADVLARRADLAEELGFDARDLQELLDRDIETENFGAAAAEVVRALGVGEALLAGTLSALTARALLAVQEALARMGQDDQRAAHDRLLGIFRAALTCYEELLRARRGSAPPRGTLRELEQEVEEARRNTAVREAMEELVRTRPPRIPLP